MVHHFSRGSRAGRRRTGRPDSHGRPVLRCALHRRHRHTGSDVHGCPRPNVDERARRLHRLQLTDAVAKVQQRRSPSLSFRTTDLQAGRTWGRLPSSPVPQMHRKDGHFRAHQLHRLHAVEESTVPAVRCTQNRSVCPGDAGPSVRSPTVARRNKLRRGTGHPGMDVPSVQSLMGTDVPAGSPAARLISSRRSREADRCPR